MSDEHADKLRRSMGSWERLHAVIIGLALTSGLKIFADAWESLPGFSFLDSSEFLLLVALAATLIPFFHGAQRHLEVVHIESPTHDRPGLLMFDFVMLFLIGAVFVVLGFTVHDPVRFLHVLIVLMIVDLVWAIATFLSQRKSEPATNPALLSWMVLDVVSILAILILWRFVSVSVWSPILALAAVIRTVFDYWKNWGFYLELPPKVRTEA